MAAIVTSLREGTWATPERLRGYPLLLLLAYAASLVWLFATADGLIDRLGRPLGTDFANIWTSGRLVLEGRPEMAFDPARQGPYQQDLLGMGRDSFYGWHYPPMFLAVATVLATLPYLGALAVWLATTGAAYLVTMRRVLAGVAFPEIERSNQIVLLLTISYPAVFQCVTHGHNGFLSAALLGGGLLLLPTRPVAAGVLIGLLAYKPQYGLLIPAALLAVGAWRAIVSAALTVAATVTLSMAAFGTKSWLAFFEFSKFTRETVLENGGSGWFKLQGVFPAVRMLGGGIATAYIAQAITCAILLVLVVWLWRSPAAYPQKAAGLILATMLANPYSFNYDSVILGPAIAFLVVDGMARGFAPYEKSLLALLWVTPLFSRELTQVITLPLATMVHAVLLGALVWKLREALPLPVQRAAYA